MYDTRTENEVFICRSWKPCRVIAVYCHLVACFSLQVEQKLEYGTLCWRKTLRNTQLRVSKNDDTLVAGLVDGLVSISRREERVEKAPQKKIKSFRHTSISQPLNVDTIVPELTHEKETKYDHHLRKFEYSKALDTVLLPYVANKNPQVTVSVMQELIRRRALHKAFKGREKKSLTQILRFLYEMFTRVLVDAANIFIDTYEDDILTLPHEIGKLFIDLSQVLKQECELVDELAALQGMMVMLLSSQVTADEPIGDSKRHNLLPSEDAQKNFVLTIS
nr:unnamed protein product [Callosobruchus chinensis]